MQTGGVLRLSLATTLLVSALGCPVELPTTSSISYTCDVDENCPSGQHCQAGHCTAAVNLDATTGGDQQAVDRPALDLQGRDQIGRDASGADQAGRDISGADQVGRDAAADAAPGDRGSDAAVHPDAGRDAMIALDAAADGGLDSALPEDGGTDATGVDSAPRSDATIEDSAPHVDAAQPDTTPFDAGCSNPALDFDGVGDLVLMSDSASAGTLTDITVEAWVRPAAAAVDGVGPFYIVAKHDTAGTRGYALQLRRGWLEFCLWDGIRDYCTWAAYDEAVKLQAARWYHVAGVYDATSRLLSIFANGALLRQESQTETPFTWAGDTTGTRLASAAGGNGGRFAGLIDEVRISSSARYAAGFSAPSAPFTSDGHTDALWHLDEATGQSVVDSAIGGTNGTLGVDSSAAVDDPAWVTTECVVDRIAATTRDAGTNVDAATGPGCSTTYGAVAGYQLCHENATTCEFAASTNGTCRALCSGLGQTCIDAFDNVTPVCDRREWMGDTCDTSRGSEICVCTR